MRWLSAFDKISILKCHTILSLYATQRIDYARQIQEH